MIIARALAIVALMCAAAAPARALTEEEERAKAHFLAGQSYYDQASYTDALREFNEAYRISKKPALLYNIARCFEGLDQLDDAVRMLERYLQEEPDTPDRAAVETRIANLKERQARVPPRLPSEPETARPATAAATPAAPATASAAPPRRKRVWTWVAAGVGVTALGAALGTGIASQLSYSDLESKCTGGHCDPATVPNAQSKIDHGKQLALATDVLWPIGVAAVAAGVVLFFVEGRHPTERPHARVVPLIAPTLGGLAVARDF